MVEQFTCDFWNEYLQEQGFEDILNTTDIPAEIFFKFRGDRLKIFKKDNYYIGYEIENLAKHRLPFFVFTYKDIAVVEFLNNMRTARNLMLLVSALANPRQLPLCMDMDWAMPLIKSILKNEI